MKIEKEPTLADSICDVRARKIKKTFFTQINTLIDWETISILINKDYSNFDNFITDFEGYINKKLITAKKNNYSTEDMIFDSIINRLELLNNYKKIAIRIFLESQKNNRYFFY